jgi:hypothetical protein
MRSRMPSSRSSASLERKSSSNRRSNYKRKLAAKLTATQGISPWVCNFGHTERTQRMYLDRSWSFTMSVSILRT